MMPVRARRNALRIFQSSTSISFCQVLSIYQFSEPIISFDTRARFLWLSLMRHVFSLCIDTRINMCVAANVLISGRAMPKCRFECDIQFDKYKFTKFLSDILEHSKQQQTMPISNSSLNYSYVRNVNEKTHTFRSCFGGGSSSGSKGVVHITYIWTELN